MSPEKITERQLERQKTIIDGWEYLKDKKGNSVKDEMGEKIKIDKKKILPVNIMNLHNLKQLIHL